jgi:threonine aldolase
MKSFASDNYSGIHPDILQAITEANQAHVSSYGNDLYTARAEQLFRSIFGKETEVLFVFNGTGANITALQCATQSFHSILCAKTAHINVDECGALMKATGCQLHTIDTPDGKLTPEMLTPFLCDIGNIHHTQPRVISITQCTEIGTVYSREELTALCNFAHQNGLYVHLDGARIANALVSLGCDAKAATVDCGIDIMSFGGTKNGLMIGEAVLIFNKNLATNAQFVRKQLGQLFSKMRFISAQFVALLENDLWLRMARHSNSMAQLLAREVSTIPQVKITQKVDANGVFALIPPAIVEPLEKEFPFYLWDEQTCEARWMCSFDTTEEEIRIFAKRIKELCAGIKA